MKRVITTTLAAILAAATLAACASPETVDPRIAEIRNQVAFQSSEFDSQTKAQGPKLDRPEYWALMRSWLGASAAAGDDAHQLYIKVAYQGEEREYRSISFPGGKREDVLVIDRKSTCPYGENPGLVCDREEHVGLYLSAGELRRAIKNNGMRLRLNAKQGGAELIVYVPAYYLAGYMAAVEPARAESYQRQATRFRSQP